MFHGWNRVLAACMLKSAAVLQAEERHRQLVSAAVARATDGVAAQKIAALEAALAAARSEAERRMAALEAELASARQEAAGLRQASVQHGRAG